MSRTNTFASATALWRAAPCVLLAGFFLVTSCGSRNLKASHRPAPSEVVVVKKGPPPHAPAHGYRHKHEDRVELVYDSGLGVYIVVGKKDCYFHGDHYLRFNKNSWEMSLSFSGPWAPAPAKSLPPGLAKKHGKETGKKHKSGKK